MRLSGIILVLLVSLGVTWSYAGHASTIPPEVTRMVPNAQMVGQGRFTYFIFDVYDAELFAPRGRWQPDGSYALRLTYLRPLKGARIAEASVKEIRRAGFKNEETLAVWGKKMAKIFPDVRRGDVITGIYRPGQGTQFVYNNRMVGRMAGDQFARQFFGIWLQPQTRDPDLRLKLLGQKEP